MKSKTSIQLTAAFLMIVFSLNTIIGFACAIGMDLGFNTTHHHDKDATQAPVHLHADGKKLHHDNEAGKHPPQIGNHHEEADNHQHKSNDEKEDCCNDKVMNFAQLDKSIPQSLHFAVNALFFTAFVSSFYHIDVLYTSQVVTSIRYFVRSYHPPIPDIRLAIQSFQI